jgi:hypothetical protein
MLSRDEVPTLKQIVSYSNDSVNRMDRYVWSWAACLFFANHPRYREAFAAASEPPLDYSMRVSQRLLQSLDASWPWVVAEWNGFLSDFDFGCDPSSSMPLLEDTRWNTIESGETIRCNVLATKGWQPTGIRVRAGQSLQITAEGSCQIGIGSNGRQWTSEPQGVTVRYHAQQPLGRLMATIIPLPDGEQTRLWQSTAIGRSADLTIESEGLLLLKINDTPGGLEDNHGSYQVAINPAPR